MKQLVEEICRAKREQGIVPVLATERELKHLLSCRGVKWTVETFKKMCEALEAEPDIICQRLLRYNGYQLKEDYDADNTEAKA